MEAKPATPCFWGLKVNVLDWAPRNVQKARRSLSYPAAKVNATFARPERKNPALFKLHIQLLGTGRMALLSRCPLQGSPYPFASTRPSFHFHCKWRFAWVWNTASELWGTDRCRLPWFFVVLRKPSRKPLFTINHSETLSLVVLVRVYRRTSDLSSRSTAGVRIKRGKIFWPSRL